MKLRILGVLLALCSVDLMAEILHYTDSRGKKVYVDSIYKVPAQYRNQMSKKAYEQKRFTSAQRQQLAQDQEAVDKRFKLQRALKKLEALKAKLQTKVKIDRRQVIVPVTVAYRGKKKVYQLLLDTGATYSVIHTQAIGKQALVGATKSAAIVAGGARVDVSDIRADLLQVGPYRFKNSPVSVMDSSDQGIDGLLGMNVLSRLKYDIDYERQLIVWDDTELNTAYERLSKLRDQVEKE